MGFKDLLVYLDSGQGHETRLNLAVELARRHAAHLTALHGIAPMPISDLPMPALGSTTEIEVIRQLQQRYRQTELERAARLRASFDAAVARADISAEWRTVEGDSSALLALHARYADLAILGQFDRDEPAGEGDAHLAEDVLLSSGRPVLVVPYVGRFETLGQNVLLAWNATREAARAANDALPILEGARSVIVLSMNPAGGIRGEGDLPAADIAHHLARHGVKATASYTVANDIEIGDLILSRAADLGSDLIVMGGYGHSRMRELILGGATRTLFDHMTVPVLFSH